MTGDLGVRPGRRWGGRRLPLVAQPSLSTDADDVVQSGRYEVHLMAVRRRAPRLAGEKADEQI